MKKLLLILLCFPTIGFGQVVNQGIDYQAVARDASGDVLMNQALTIQFSFISDITTSTISWQETHQDTTNAYGLFTAIIGQGTSTNAGSSSTFDVIDWGASNHLLKVEIDYDGSGTWVNMGTTSFMSVPYSMNAKTASNVDSTDELQSLSISGDTIFITSGNYIIIHGISIFNSLIVTGCINPLACNYNPLAHIDDGSCSGLKGCIDPTACNYDSTATCDDGSCILPDGCTDSLYANYDSLATCDDGSCFRIGSAYQGGIVFWLNGNGGGLITTPSSISSAVWGCSGTNIPGADGIAIGTGSQNTIDIEAGCTTSGTAADHCANYTDGTYSDWFLPSKDELNEMYLNLHQQGLGGFAGIYYWSSTEYDNFSAWGQSFSDGSQNYFFKNYNYINGGFSVRPVRYFGPVNGCIDPLACNYNPFVTIDDGSCLYPGCTDPLYAEYNPLATCDDGSCAVFQPPSLSVLQTAVDLWISDNALALSTYGPINNWDVSLITSMFQLLINKTTFNDDISNWNVSNVTNMKQMFEGASSFNQDLSAWDVSSVTDMGELFKYASSFNGDITTWNVSSVTNMIYLFFAANDFNQDISDWAQSPSSISQVSYMNSMFGDVSASSSTSLSAYNKCEIHMAFSVNSNYDQYYNIWAIGCVSGCTDHLASNYDALATTDDGSCIYSGCMDSTTTNYNELATVDDGSCIYPGCIYTTACNYNSSATVYDGTCIFPDGCTDSLYANYDSLATCDDGSCFRIGSAYQGGIVFWLNGNGGGLITTPSLISSAVWGCSGTNIPGADGVGIGTGSQNTIDIEAGCTTSGIAADICANLTLGGFSDWFLPSRDELNQMYLNIGQGNANGLGNIGGFANNYYWSSSEYDNFSAWGQSFSDGSQNNNDKDNNYRVRAVRAF